MGRADAAAFCREQLTRPQPEQGRLTEEEEEQRAGSKTAAEEKILESVEAR